MAFVIRQPFALSKAITSIPKAPFRSSGFRSFHDSSRSTANHFFTPRTIAPASPFTRFRHAFQNSSRAYIQPARAPASSDGSLGRRLLVSAGVMGGAVVGLNLIFNRETREYGGMPLFEREYLNQTFLHTGLGVAIIATSARAMFRSGFVYRMMATNPWVVMIGGVAVSLGTMIGTRATNPDK